MAFKRYDIFWVSLDPARGSELRKTRPGVIVSLDVLNRALATVVVCPLTSQLHPNWRTRLDVKVAGKTVEIAADQIRAVSKARLEGSSVRFRREMLPLCAVCSARCMEAVETSYFLMVLSALPP